MILLVNKKQNITRAEQLWARDKIEETLITFPRRDAVQAHFQRGLEQLGVEWFPGIEVNSTRLIEPYVAHDYGIGLTVAAPGFRSPPGVRAIRLPGFSPVIVGVAWAGKLSPIAQQFLAEVEIEADAVKQNTKSR
jgi:DNA-binding transcriptional LysR family regulator